MISFSFSEIFLSVIYSIFWGITLAFLYESARIISFLPETISLIFRKTNFSNAGKIYLSNQTITQKIIFFLSFTLGTILLSYFALDGLIRLYVIAVSLATFYLVKKMAFYLLEGILYTLLSIILFPIARLWRKKRL